MKRPLGILVVAAAVAAFAWITTQERRYHTDAAVDEPSNGKASQSGDGPMPASPVQTKAARSVRLAAKASLSRDEDPDASLPPIEETLRAARSDVFNFKHHLCQCQCDLDENRLMGVLTKANLKWPRIQYELGGVAMEHNLRVREDEALRLLEKDPAAAVEYMATHIRYETDKQTTATAAAKWRESIRDGSRGESAAFGQMLEQLPDSSFDGMVSENLPHVTQSPDLRNMALENSFKRPRDVRLKTLARLADEGLLEGSPYQDRARIELVALIGHAPGENGSWLQEVAERL